MDAIKARVSKLRTAMLKEMAVKLFTSPAEGSEIVLSVVLSELEARLPEAEFITFCDAI